MSKHNTYDSMKTPDLSSQDKKAMKSLDSQWLETKAHRDHWEGVVKRYKDRGQPDFLIEHAERIAKLTHWEYRLECNENTRLWEEERDEYVRGNPMKESVVEELYRRFDKIMDEFCEESDSALCYGSSVLWLRELHPLDIMNNSDLAFVYTPLINSLHGQFLKKHGK